MTSVSPLQYYILHDALHTFQGNPCGMVGALHGVHGHDDAGDEQMFWPLVPVRSTSLSHVKGKSEVPAADFLDPRQSRCKYVWDDYRFRKGNPVAVSHFCCLPVVNCPYEARKAHIDDYSIQIFAPSKIRRAPDDTLTNVSRHEFWRAS